MGERKSESKDVRSETRAKEGIWEVQKKAKTQSRTKRAERKRKRRGKVSVSSWSRTGWKVEMRSRR
jgi:hypothetical protein